eukprot:415254-Prymnesium_polylepis.1
MGLPLAAQIASVKAGERQSHAQPLELRAKVTRVLVVWFTLRVRGDQKARARVGRGRSAPAASV